MIPADAATIALVDDDDDLRGAIAQTLDLAGYRVRPFDRAEAALAAVDADFPGVVVTDVRMPGMDGITLFRRLRDRDADLPVLLMTGHGDVPMAVAALQAGAWDFLTKPFDPDALVAAIGRAVAHRSLALDNRRLRAMAESADPSPLVGRSPAIARLRETIALLAGADLDVFIEGETGTGKELVARLIHRGSCRARGRFTAISCAAVPEGLLDSDLFAASGPVAGAHNGTLFIDDVDRASPALQARLAQLAEDRAIRLPERREPMPVDCRLIATADDGDQTMRIQPALFYRLAAMRLRVPPLRERIEDVPLLFAHLLDQAAARLRRAAPDLTPEVREKLLRHDWPGNVRELAHYADRVLLGLTSPAAPAAPTANDPALPDRVAAFERQAIVDAVRQSDDIGAAIASLGLPRKTFYYRVQRLGIDLAALKRDKAGR